MSNHENPFTVKTPEGMPAKDAVDLFVNVFTDFPKINGEGHIFLNGPRGSGKSMMFRLLEPDCQVLQANCSLHDISFFGVYVSIKNTNLNITELDRLENQHAANLMNEHLMSIFLASIVFNSFLAKGKKPPKLKFPIQDPQGEAFSELLKFIKNDVFTLLAECGWVKPPPSVDTLKTPLDCFNYLKVLFDQVYKYAIRYINSLSFATTPIPYDGPLCGYLNFLLPLIIGLKNLRFMPQGPIFLLLDDADNLSLTQTKVLNSWVSTRTSSDLSLKISTQLNYKTYKAINGNSIATPHDYSEINISDIYTNRKSNYIKRVKEIIEKRLSLKGLNTNPENFFPPNQKQEDEIISIGEEIRRNWERDGRGNQPGDDVSRYARPNYIKNLKGKRKSGSTYSYAGFEQLVHISSGIIRFFLEPASLMFSEQASHSDKQISFIKPTTQDKIISEQADKFIFGEFDKLEAEESDETTELDRPKLLRNLINALGGTFHQILISERSERRVFSFAFSDSPDREIREILNLGLRWGYFQESTIGNKQGTGRTRLYILSRRLAPHFKLDPTGFAGYLFVTQSQIKEAMHYPRRLLKRIEEEGLGKDFESRQFLLFD